MVYTLDTAFSFITTENYEIGCEKFYRNYNQFYRNLNLTKTMSNQSILLYKAELVKICPHLVQFIIVHTIFQTVNDFTQLQSISMATWLYAIAQIFFKKK